MTGFVTGASNCINLLPDNYYFLLKLYLFIISFNKMNAVEMRMSRWMCGNTRKDRIRHECFWEYLEVEIKRDLFEMVGHVQCRPATTPVRKSFSLINYRATLNFSSPVSSRNYNSSLINKAQNCLSSGVVGLSTSANANPTLLYL